MSRYAHPVAPFEVFHDEENGIDVRVAHMYAQSTFKGLCTLDKDNDVDEVLRYDNRRKRYYFVRPAAAAHADGDQIVVFVDPATLKFTSQRFISGHIHLANDPVPVLDQYIDPKRNCPWQVSEDIRQALRGPITEYPSEKLANEQFQIEFNRAHNRYYDKQHAQEWGSKRAREEEVLNSKRMQPRLEAGVLHDHFTPPNARSPQLSIAQSGAPHERFPPN